MGLRNVMKEVTERYCDKCGKEEGSSSNLKRCCICRDEFCSEHLGVKLGEIILFGWKGSPQEGDRYICEGCLNRQVVGVTVQQCLRETFRIPVPD